MNDKKTTANVVPMVDPQQMAREAFTNHVQSVAFHMTLSRHMIEGLCLVRDWGFQWFHKGGTAEAEKSEVFRNGMSKRLDSYAVPLMDSLKRRGLIYHDWIPIKEAPEGHKFYKLTRAGELMCLLLVEAGLMPAAKSRKRRA